MNNITLIGRIAQNLELKQTQTGLSVVSFTLAVDRRSKDKQTDWIDCVAWRQTAEFIGKYFKKGDPIAVIGSLQTRNYEDKEGRKHKATEVVADNVEFVPKTHTDGEKVDVLPKNADEFVSADDEDLPF